MSLKSIVGFFISWRVVLILISLIATIIIPYKPGYSLLNYQEKEPSIINSWANFDGIHYLELAKYGYGSVYTNYHYAFFPVYPWLIKVFNLFNSYVISGLLVSHLSLVLAIFFLYKLVRLDFSKKIAINTIILLMLFPTSFFFGSVYTESIFLLLTVASIYFSRKNNYFIASIFALIASATRVTGILVWLAILTEYLQSKKFKLKQLVSFDIIWLAIPPLGLIDYLKFQFIKTGDYLFFVHQQPGFGANRVVDKIILIHQVFYRYVKMMIFTDHTDPLFFVVCLEFVTGLLFLILCLVSFKKLRLSYSIYSIISFFIPTFTGTFSSLPRYVLVIFPAFIILSTWFTGQKKAVKAIYSTASIVAAVIATSLFVRGYFIG